VPDIMTNIPLWFVASLGEGWGAATPCDILRRRSPTGPRLLGLLETGVSGIVGSEDILLSVLGLFSSSAGELGGSEKLRFLFERSTKGL
jgi:hypothetical protein